MLHADPYDSSRVTVSIIFRRQVARVTHLPASPPSHGVEPFQTNYERFFVMRSLFFIAPLIEWRDWTPSIGLRLGAPSFFSVCSH